MKVINNAFQITVPYKKENFRIIGNHCAKNDSLGLREKKPSFVSPWKHEAEILVCRCVLFGMKLTVPSKISSPS